MIDLQKIHKLFGIAIFSIILGMPFVSMNVNGAQNTSPLELEAVAVVDQYFTALINGEVGTISNLLGPKLLMRRARLLSNPDYSEKLSEIYNNAVVTLTVDRVIDFVTVAVLAEVTYSNAEQTRFILILKKSGQSGMRIFSEEELIR